mmetsp:Transcript_85264/g.182734  ORF Transcript_85264/g.182734 Transcript_85264/m.182734 type:complete len:441 (-) Transcript_85264:177-1499(-)
MTSRAQLGRLVCCLSLRWSLVAGRCLTGLPLPSETDCSLGGCCDSVDKAVHDWVPPLLNRTGAVTNLIEQLASAYPVSIQLGVKNLETAPISADVLVLGKPIQLVASLHVLRISAIDQKKQNYVMQYVVNWMWRDCRLAFNCTDILPLHEDSASFSSFWRPRYHLAEQETEEESMRKSTLSIQGYGTSIYSDAHVSTLNCPFKFGQMPFDEQTCKLTFTLPGYSSSEATLLWSSLPVTSKELSNSEWEITQGAQWATSARDVHRESRGFFAPMTEAEISVEFKLKRKPGFLSNQFILPVVLFYVLSYMGLWLSADSVPARVAADVIPALAVSNKMNALASILPPISSPTKLGSFLVFSQVLIVLHFVEYGFKHVAQKRVKTIADEAKRAESANAEEGVEKTQGNRAAERIWTFAAQNSDPAARLLSPLLYVFVGLLILYA